jgi:hypothetical protein
LLTYRRQGPLAVPARLGPLLADPLLYGVAYSLFEFARISRPAAYIFPVAMPRQVRNCLFMERIKGSPINALRQGGI